MTARTQGAIRMASYTVHIVITLNELVVDDVVSGTTHQLLLVHLLLLQLLLMSQSVPLSLCSRVITAS